MGRLNDQLKSLIAVARDSAKARRVLADPAAVDARRATCFACPKAVADRCTACGCKIQRKTAAFAAKCPDGKW